MGNFTLVAMSKNLSISWLLAKSCQKTERFKLRMNTYRHLCGPGGAKESEISKDFQRILDFRNIHSEIGILDARGWF